MKKILLALTCLPLFLSAQVFIQEDFENVPLGNFGTDYELLELNNYGWGLLSTNDSQGQIPTSTNAGPENFLIVQEDSKKLRITGPNATTGLTLAIPIVESGLRAFWNNIDLGNQILKVSTTVNIADGSSLNIPIIGIFDTQSYIGGVYFNTANNIVYGIAYISGSQGNSAYLINFAEGGLSFQRNTNYNFDIYFDQATGVVSWVSPELGVDGAIETLKAGVEPNEVDFGLLNGTNSQATNMSAGSFTIDNVLIEAIPEITMSTQNLQVAGLMESKIYPNPAKETVNIALAAGFDNAKVHVVLSSVNGKKVAEYNTTENLNISHLPAGVYIITVTDGKKTESHKLIKK
ncbi:MAG: T9SS type A sorting domain-containing protein [Flavobacteriaceae bacterium]|nr:T9SS type A sorting domain-containing protein [Flavobacteriaceae bacterium]